MMILFVKKWNIKKNLCPCKGFLLRENVPVGVAYHATQMKKYSNKPRNEGSKKWENYLPVKV